MPEIIPVHPENTADVQTLRWVVPAGTLPFVGAIAAVSAPLAALQQDGTITHISADPTAVLLTLSADKSWQNWGAKVRDALQASLRTAHMWQPADDSTSAAEREDAILQQAVEGVRASSVGEYIRSHGGELSVVEVSSGVVTVALSGACSKCALRGETIGNRVKTAISRQYPGLKEVILLSEDDVCGDTNIPRSPSNSRFALWRR